MQADSDLKTQWKMKLLLTDEGTVDSVEGELITLTDFDPFSVGVSPSLKLALFERKTETNIWQSLC